MKRIALLACSKRKIKSSYLLQARSLYQGCLFKKAYSFAKLKKMIIFILSAKYGLLHPCDVVDYYEETLNNKNKKERKKWAKKVIQQMQKKEIFRQKNNILYYFAGRNYWQYLPQGRYPLKNLPLGKQLQWLNLKIKKLLLERIEKCQ